MYVYQLMYDHGANIKTIGYFGSWKKARAVMKNTVHLFRDLRIIPIVFQ